MQSAADMTAELMERMRRAATMANSSDLADVMNMSTLELERRKVERYNRTPGNLDTEDGYQCSECMNRGHFYHVAEDAAGMPRLYSVPCKCQNARISLARMRRSGLEGVIGECTFAAYNAAEDWQKAIKAKAIQFTEDDAAKWFFIGGASGGGKTHLCTAICRHYLKTRPVYYMLWEDELKRLNAVVNDDEAYTRHMDKLKNIDVLYIDDFLKPIYDERGGMKLPTPGDMKRAYELINHRYVEKSITIISSERYSGEITELDQAIGGRIVQRARGYVLNVARDPARNYRTKGDELL